MPESDLTMPTEKHLDKQLKRALEGDDRFRAWFVKAAKIPGNEPECLLCRADNPWGTAEFSIFDSQTGTTKLAKRQSETDVLFVFRFKDQPERRIALHIENKLAAGNFTPHQPSMYAARAKSWAGKEKYKNYSEWQTVLVAPLSFYEKHEQQAEQFGVFISHENIMEVLPAFGTGAATQLG